MWNVLIENAAVVYLIIKGKRHKTHTQLRGGALWRPRGEVQKSTDYDE